MAVQVLLLQAMNKKNGRATTAVVQEAVVSGSGLHDGAFVHGPTDIVECLRFIEDAMRANPNGGVIVRGFGSEMPVPFVAEDPPRYDM